MLAVAKEFPDTQFAVAQEESFEGRLKELGLTESGEDVNVGLYDESGRRFAMVDEEFNEDTLTEFLEEFQKGMLVFHVLVFFLNIILSRSVFFCAIYKALIINL